MIVFFLVVHRCVMCRAEAHQLYSRKPIFDAMGVQLVAVLNELIDAEVLVIFSLADFLRAFCISLFLSVVKSITLPSVLLFSFFS